MVVTNKEVEKDTDDAQVTCTVNGVTVKPTIVWKNSAGDDVVKNDGTNYQEDDAKSKFTIDSHEHVSVLNVKAAKTDTDQKYTCFVTSAEWAKNDEPHVVVLNVLGMYFSGVIFLSGGSFF